MGISYSLKYKTRGHYTLSYNNQLLYMIDFSIDQRSIIITNQSLLHCISIANQLLHKISLNYLFYYECCNMVGKASCAESGVIP